jgi:DNA polymerase-3 subunit beta
MKIIFDKHTLLEKLVPAMSTVSGKNTITSIEGILIETIGGNTVRLSSYDMNKGIRSTLEAVSVEEGGSYIINAQRLFQIVKLLGDEEIVLEVSPKLSVTISSGASSFSLYALNGSDFPSLPELTGDKGFSVRADIFRKIISKVLHSVAEQDQRQMLCGAYFVINKDAMELVSCDGYTLSRCKIGSSVSDIGRITSEKFSFIIPGHALNELIRILPDKEEEARVYLSRKHAIIEMNDITFFTRMIDSEYMDYQRIIPKEQSIFVKIDRARLLEGLERANLVAEEKIQGSGKSYVKLEIKDNVFSLSSNSVNGNVFDQMECEHEGEDIVIGFNCRFLINSVRAAESDVILMTLKSPTQSITIEPSEDKKKGSYFYMILPVRMTE